MESILNFLLLFLIIAFTSTQENGCPIQWCECKYKNKVKCVNHGKNLSFIPSVPQTVKIITFSGNYLPNMTAETFHNISELAISNMNLSVNDIETISRDAFKVIEKFYVLDLSSNTRLRLDTLAAAFNSTNFVQQSSLYLNNITKVGYLPGDLFDEMPENKLRSLYLQSNNLLSVDGTIFKNLRYLNELDLSHNKLFSISLDSLSRLTRLTLGHNNLYSIPRFYTTNGTSLTPRLQVLDVNNNQVKSLKSVDFIKVRKLKSLCILNNPIHVIENNVFASLRKLRNIRILPVGRSLKKIDSFAFKSSNVNQINMADANFKFRHDKFDPDNIFKHCPRLRTLILSYNEVPHDSATAIKMFGSLSLLRQLTLQNVGWTFIPKDLFHRLVSLQTLELDSNSIFSSSLNNPFEKVYTLTYLGLGGNKMNTILPNFLPENILGNLTGLNLARNPFSCNCRNMWFVKWLNKTKIRLQEYPNNYFCVTPYNWRGKAINTYNENCVIDISTHIRIILITTSSIVVGLLALVTLTYRLRWHIRYWIYLLYGKRRSYTEIDPCDIDYLYDGFVVYCDADRKWVHDNLVPFLEQDYGYRLCIHYRDFQVGNLIVDNIVDNMRKSRKILIIVSNAFCRSKWCHFEILMAHEKFLNQGGDTLVSILLEDVQPKYFTNTLKHILTSTTYAVWTNEESGQYIFWEQIKGSFQVLKD